MRRRAISRPSATFLVAAALGLSVAAAHAGPCSSRIAQFEQAVRQSAGNPNAGPMAPQSIGPQLNRQPTPASIKRAEERAKAAFAATLARAKRLDATRRPYQDACGPWPPASECTICNDRWGPPGFCCTRHERFRESDASRRAFEGVVAKCIAAGLVGG